MPRLWIAVEPASCGALCLIAVGNFKCFVLFDTFLVVVFGGYRELIAFPIDLHSNSTLSALEIIAVYDWSSKFYFNSKPRLITAK